MLLFWLLLIAIQCSLLFVFWQGARALILEGKQQSNDPRPRVPSQAHRHIPGLRPDPSPTVAMIIPLSGQRPQMFTALRSLLVQEYSNVLPVMVTADLEDPAVELIHRLQQDFPQVCHVVAGTAHGCGQKNWNTLQALATVGDAADIYVFCDSTHEARPDFVRELILPIIRHESAFTTGYHSVDAEDKQLVTLAYQLSVLLMRFLQALSAFTQPWGGAMAISRQAFLRYGIADFWRDKVVDDCSLASFLMRRHVHVQLAPQAVLRTPARDHSPAVWRAWMDRQVLFLKFCVPAQWALLGAFAALMALPLALSALAVMGVALTLLPLMLLLPALIHALLLMAILLGWRECLPKRPPALRWCAAFVLSMGQFLRVYLSTIPAKGILWNHIFYLVGREGRVLTSSIRTPKAKV